MTPNESPGQIHPMAVTELKAWQKIALTWSTIKDDGYYRCCDCLQAIWREVDNNGRLYRTRSDEILALKVAHIRQRHPEVKDWNWN